MKVQAPDTQVKQLKEMSATDKCTLLSDFHKDVYGFRPKVEGLSEKEKVEMYDATCAELDYRKSTLAGRNALRANSWIIPEPIDDHFKREMLKPLVSVTELSEETLQPGFILMGLTKFQGMLIAQMSGDAQFAHVDLGSPKSFGSSSNDYKVKTLCKTMREACDPQAVLILRPSNTEPATLAALVDTILKDENLLNYVLDKVKSRPNNLFTFDPFEL